MLQQQGRLPIETSHTLASGCEVRDWPTRVSIALSAVAFSLYLMNPYLPTASATVNSEMVPQVSHGRQEKLGTSCQEL